MAVLKNIRRAEEGPSEQLFPDFYSEHTTLAMNRERSKQSLVKLHQLYDSTGPFYETFYKNSFFE